MASTKTKKWALIILAAIVLLVVGAIVGFQAAVGLLKGKVVEALGPDSEVKELRVREPLPVLNHLLAHQGDVGRRATEGDTAQFEKEQSHFSQVA